MKKILSIVIFVVLIPSLLWAACTSSTPDRTTLAACIAAADRNATITVSAGDGTETWSSYITITKGLTIVGPGLSNLTITGTPGSYSGMITVSPDSTMLSNDEQFEISGFTFDLNNTTGSALVIGDRYDLTPLTNILIHDNKFQNNAYGGAGLVYINGMIYGVGYDNQFDTTGICVRNIGASDASPNIDGYDSWNLLSAPSSAFGSANNFYWEDNNFTGNAFFFYTEKAGRHAIRYNDFHYTTGGYEATLDMHGNQSLACATMLAEFYGNDITNDTSTDTFTQRGGQAILLYNRTGSTAGAWKQYSDSLWTGDCDSASNPSERIPKTYNVNNRANSTVIDMYELSDAQGHIAEDSTFFNYNTSYDGSTGVGCGEIGDRPASPSLTGTGYFVPDNISTMPCSSVSSTNIGVSPSVPITGTLYYWDGDSWEEKWTPYTYPHPLRGEAEVVPANSMDGVSLSNLHVTHNLIALNAWNRTDGLR